MTCRVLHVAGHRTDVWSTRPQHDDRCLSAETGLNERQGFSEAAAIVTQIELYPVPSQHPHIPTATAGRPQVAVSYRL